MGTVADKLNKVLSTKDAIKAAIVEKGQTVADTDTFASYPDKIRAIESGEETFSIMIDFTTLSGKCFIYHSDVSTSTPIFISEYHTSENGAKKIDNVRIGDVIVVQTRYESEYVADECNHVYIETLDLNTHIIMIAGSEPGVTFQPC